MVVLTFFPRRVKESIIRDVMVSYLVRHNLLSINQHGFFKEHSTGLQIIECMNDCSLSIEFDKCVDVYLDFSRAFDTVSIPKLLHKINAYGFKGQLYALLADFCRIES